MDAWGARAFENDAAMAWVAELRAGGAGAVAAALDEVLAMRGADRLGAAAGARARAAAEAVAAAFGHGPDGLPGDVASALRAHDEAIRDLHDIRRRANNAIARVWADNSELNALWSEADERTRWHRALSDLTGRLGMERGL